MISWYFLFAGFFVLCRSDLIINSPSQFTKTYNAPSSRLEDIKWQAITGQVVATKTDACETIDVNATGKLILYKYLNDRGVNRCPYSTRLLTIQKAGAIAGIMMGDGIGSSAYIMRTERFSGLRIHAVTIANDKELWNLVMDSNNFINATISPGENAFQVFFKSEAPMVIFSLVLGSYAFVCFCFATWKFTGFIIYRKKKMTIPAVVLGIEICSSIIRMIHMVDPVYSRGILNFQAISILITLSNPFTFASTLLLCFYWEIITEKWATSLAIPSLFHFKYPAIILIIFFFFITLLDSISRACYAEIPNLLVVTPVIFILLSVAIAITYIIAGVRLLRRITPSGAQPISKRKKNLRRITILIILCAVSLVCMVLAWIFYSAALSSPPSGQYFAWWTVFGTQYTVSLCLILVFQRPTSDNDSSGGSSEQNHISKSNSVSLP